jgi:hypothetical protein
VRTGHGAVTADRLRSVMLTEVWSRTGPPKRNRPAMGGTINRPGTSKAALDNSTNSTANLAAQRSIRTAIRRVAEIERRAEIADALGLRGAAGRLAGIAADIRAQVLA